MKKIDYGKMIKRVSIAEANKERWRPILQDCYKFFLPNRDTINEQSTGDEKQEEVFDSTAMDAISDYASRMESQLVPSGREWLKLEAGSSVPDEMVDEVDKLLEQNTTILFQHINSSNFSSQIQECFLDLAVSTGAIIVEEGNGVQSSLRFRCVPLANLILERSKRGIVETVWQRLKIHAGDIAGVLPHIVANLTDELKKTIEESPEEEIVFIEGVVYNDETNDYTSMILYEGESEVLYEEQLESSPWVVFREMTTPNETYGRGRAIRCLPDVKVINRVMQYYIEACELNGNPIYLAVDDGVINPNTIKVRPKSIVPVADKDSIVPLPMSGQPQLIIDLIQRLQDSIRRTLLSKPFGQIDETPVRTATEMTIRNAELSQTTLSAGGRIQTELLERIVARCVYILKKNGKMADVKVDGKEVAIKFTSPSARTQDEVEIASIVRFMETVQILPPELINATVKVEDFPVYLADKLGIDKTLIRSESERDDKNREMQEQQLALQQTEGGV